MKIKYAVFSILFVVDFCLLLNNQFLNNMNPILRFKENIRKTCSSEIFQTKIVFSNTFEEGNKKSLSYSKDNDSVPFLLPSPSIFWVNPSPAKSWNFCIAVDCDNSSPCLKAQMKRNSTCCSSYLNYMFTLFNDMSENFNLTWLPAFGTLLGLYRDSNFLPWTFDVDIFLFNVSISEFVNNKLFADFWWERGFIFVDDGLIRICPHEKSRFPIKRKENIEHDRIYMDIYPSYFHLNATQLYSYEFPNSWILPLAKKFLFNQWIPFPYHTHHILEQWYKNYTVPIFCDHNCPEFYS